VSALETPLELRVVIERDAALNECARALALFGGFAPILVDGPLFVLHGVEMSIRPFKRSGMVLK
jgi:hypothetical protein